jgi:alpha-glucosidase
MSTKWWQHGVIYQVYPRSFADANGDGVGDLRGISDRLDYLQCLGVDAIWLSPIFPSPMADFGYDVADYTDVDPAFGTLAEFDALVADMHSRNMRLLLDYVPNHTSDEHPWFVDARSSRDARHRGWYIWRDPAADGGPPNGWQSAFGGSAWEWDEQTGQYYFHAFLKEQPDLDWTNPQVPAAMADVLRFWLDRGVDGFRVDVIWLLGKGPELESGGSPLVAGGPGPATEGLGGDQPHVHRIIGRLRRVLDEYDDRMMIGEIYLPTERLVRYYGTDGRGVHLPFNFQLLLLPWQAADIHAAITEYEGLLPAGAWPNWVLGNHDTSRITSRVGAAQARVAAMMLLTLRGTPTLYYGDEIGMADVNVGPAEQRDPQGLRGGRSRDPCRAPMRWDGGPGAGFTSGRPWLPVGDRLDEINVAAQRDDAGSMLNLHRRLLELRRREPALHAGEWRDLGASDSVLTYLRTDGERRFLIALNLAGWPAALPSEVTALGGRIEVATDHRRQGERFDPSAGLAADEGVVVLLD